MLPHLERNLELRRQYVACFEPRRRPVRRRPRRLRARHEDGRGRGDLRRAEGGAPADDPRGRRRRPDRRLVPARPLPARRAAALLARDARAVGHGPRVVAARPDRASVRDVVRADRHPAHDELPRGLACTGSSRACTSSATASTSARSIPRTRARRSRRACRPRSTSRRAACGRTSSAAASRPGGSSIRRLQEEFPDQFGDVSLEDVPPRAEQGAAVVPARRRGRGDVLPAHHPALRARARHALRRGRAARICPRRSTRRCASTSGSSRRTSSRGVLQDVHWSDMTLRLLPDVRARQRRLGPAVGARRGRPRRPRRAVRARRVRRRCASGSRENVHRHGRAFTPQELLQRVDRLGDGPGAVPPLPRAEARRPARRRRRVTAATGSRAARASATPSRAVAAADPLAERAALVQEAAAGAGGRQNAAFTSRARIRVAQRSTYEIEERAAHDRSLSAGSPLEDLPLGALR